MIKHTTLPAGRAWAELDRDALRRNVETLRARLPAGCSLMPAVKANAYGHGADLLVPELEGLGVGHFCVASAAEGAELREAGVRGEILILGWTHPGDAPLLSRYNLTQTVPEAAYARELDRYGVPVRVQLKLDTGMHRLGERPDRVQDLVSVFDLPSLTVTGAFTHLCATGDRAFTLAQGRSFHAAVAELRARGCVLPQVHLLASDGLLRWPELGGDFARVGIALYGAVEDPSAGLRPVLSLKARVAQVRELSAGEFAGYGLRFTARRPTRLAVLTIGYGDGLPRALSCGVGGVLLHGDYAPVAGLICMDQTLVDVTGIPEAAAGDVAVLIGRDGGQEITACEMAKRAGTISNEILSRLGARLERVMV